MAGLTGQSYFSVYYRSQYEFSPFGLNWNVAGTGGGTISSTHFTVSSTIGQTTVGTANSQHYEVCVGYWCWFDYIANIFLPMISNK